MKHCQYQFLLVSERQCVSLDLGMSLHLDRKSLFELLMMALSEIVARSSNILIGSASLHARHELNIIFLTEVVLVWRQESMIIKWFHGCIEIRKVVQSFFRQNPLRPQTPTLHPPHLPPPLPTVPTLPLKIIFLKLKKWNFKILFDKFWKNDFKISF